MIQNKTTLETKAPLLEAEETKNFISKMEQLLKKLDFKAIIDFTKNYPFNTIDQNELNDFIDRAEEENSNWYENPLCIKINSVEAFDTKCIACSFGKTVKAYRVEYNQMNDEQLPGVFIYTRSIAINFDIKNNELNDFGWCNMFLEKKDMQEINKKID